MLKDKYNIQCTIMVALYSVWQGIQANREHFMLFHIGYGETTTAERAATFEGIYPRDAHTYFGIVDAIFRKKLDMKR